ncbi:MAG: hypothetical protein ABI551_24425 [Polyangiaceae bacterium]
MNDNRETQQQIQNDDRLEDEWRAKIQRALRDLRSMSSVPSQAKAS